MSNVTEIEEAVGKLDQTELSKFRAWFQSFDAEVWDRQFEEDAKSGKLAGLAEEALREFDEGRCKKL